MSLRDELARQLGVDRGAVSDRELLEALDEALLSRCDPSAGAAANRRTLVPLAELAQLRREAEGAHEAAEAADRAARESIVAAAVASGAIAAAHAGHWLRLLEHDRSAAASLQKIPAGTAVPMTSSGYTGGTDQSSDDDSPDRLK